MKTTLWVMGISLLLALPAKAQFFNSSHVPEGAKLAFHQQYPKAKHASWTKEEIGYEVRFDLHRKTYFVLYDAAGNSAAEIVIINKARLPKRVKRQLRDNYTSFAIQGAIKVRSSVGKVTYGIHIGRAEESYDLVFNESGYMVSIVGETDEMKIVAEE